MPERCKNSTILQAALGPATGQSGRLVLPWTGSFLQWVTALMLGVAMGLFCVPPLGCQRFAARNFKGYTRQNICRDKSLEFQGFGAKVTENKQGAVCKVLSSYWSGQGQLILFSVIHHRLTESRYIDRLRVVTREAPQPMTIAAVRTPEDRFANIPDFDYPVYYADDLPGYEGLRAAWIDTGPADAEKTFLCLHGEPSWSFLYRKMIPHFTATGARVVCPDFFGFGRSDKPTELETYTFDFHRNHILALVERLDLKNVTLVMHDWGGIIGLTLPVDEDFKGRLSRLIIMNTALAIGAGESAGFNKWKEYALTTPIFDAGEIIAGKTPQLTAEEVAAYNAPYPDSSYQSGARTFPALVPVSPDMDGVAVSKQAVAFWSSEWSGPSFMAIGGTDPVVGPPVMNIMCRLIKGCPEPLLIKDAGHFVQEWGDVVAPAALKAFGDI